MRDLPNPFVSAPEAVRPAAAAFLPQARGAAAVGASSAEVFPTIAPGMARSENSNLSGLVECVHGCDVVETPPSADAPGDDSAAALDLPAFLKRNPDNTFKSFSVTE